jgi:hypothetical protein
VRSTVIADCARLLAGDNDHRITICSSLGLEAAFDALLHEWAHILVFEEEGIDPDVHPSAFWIKFGELYRAWHRCP